ncbi:hypothetical protein ACFO4L_15860 [Bacillus daqingensis]|uniref:Uncharacterized protein n=1 Tax=Bacillus daqingensis TaxID=872396 RepID=A0ABV9P063_9BACI
MREQFYQSPVHQSVLHLVTEALKEFTAARAPSPTIRQLAQLIGCSEETILESIEFGRQESIGLLQ